MLSIPYSGPNPPGGATLTPLVSTYTPLDTTVAEPRPGGGSNWELPILTQIYPSVDAGVPPQFPTQFPPQCFRKDQALRNCLVFCCSLAGSQPRTLLAI